MRKITLWFLSTLSVVVLLFGYHTSTDATSSAATPPAFYSGAQDTTSAPSPTSSSDALGASAAGPSTTDASPASPSATPSASAAGSAPRTVTGDTAATQWGPVQVELTVSGGTITQVDVPQYPSGNGRDDEINSYALPILIKETLSAQDAQIDMVSGATVTSGGYLQSLQSAIDHAGLS